jgi:carbonic anhydrase
MLAGVLFSITVCLVEAWSPKCSGSSGDLEDVCQLQRGSPKRVAEGADRVPQVQKHEEEEADCHKDFKVFPYVQAHLWGTSYEGWEQCGGLNQSPINLGTPTQTVASPKLDVKYHEKLVPSTMNNGHSVQVEGDFVQLTLGSAEYDSAQFHFHHPSEHQVNGRQAVMEMHIVTKGEHGVAVIGILFDLGAHNHCLMEALARPPKAGCEKHVGPTDLHCFHRQLTGPWWSYNGSLTTPPCTEGISWNVMKRRATISWHQLQKFETRFSANARPVQPLNGRNLTLHFVH